MDREFRRRLVVVGNGGAGKTSLLFILLNGIFPEGYLPKVLDGHGISVELRHRSFQIMLLDTAADDDFEHRSLPLEYNYADAVLLCFGVDNPDSLNDVEETWLPELRHFIGKLAPIYLVGCKADLRTDTQTITQLASRGQSVITANQGEQMATRIEAAAYFECSSKTGEGVRPLFLHVFDAMYERIGPPVKVRWDRDKAIKETGCIVM